MSLSVPSTPRNLSPLNLSPSMCRAGLHLGSNPDTPLSPRSSCSPSEEPPRESLDTKVELVTQEHLTLRRKSSLDSSGAEGDLKAAERNKQIEELRLFLAQRIFSWSPKGGSLASPDTEGSPTSSSSGSSSEDEEEESPVLFAQPPLVAKRPSELLSGKCFDLKVDTSTRTIIFTTDVQLNRENLTQLLKGEQFLGAWFSASTSQFHIHGESIESYSVALRYYSVDLQKMGEEIIKKLKTMPASQKTRTKATLVLGDRVFSDADTYSRVDILIEPYQVS